MHKAFALVFLLCSSLPALGQVIQLRPGRACTGPGCSDRYTPPTRLDGVRAQRRGLATQQSYRRYASQMQRRSLESNRARASGQRPAQNRFGMYAPRVPRPNQRNGGGYGAGRRRQMDRYRQPAYRPNNLNRLGMLGPRYPRNNMRPTPSPRPYGQRFLGISGPRVPKPNQRRASRYRERHAGNAFQRQRAYSFNNRHRRLDAAGSPGAFQRSIIGNRRPHGQRTGAGYALGHRRLDGRSGAFPGFRSARRNYDRFSGPAPWRLSRRQLDGVRQGGFWMGHRNLDANRPGPGFRMRRRNLDGYALPRFGLGHRSLEGHTQPRYRLGRRSFDAYTQPRYAMRHRGLDAYTQPRYRLGRRSFDAYTQPRYAMRHRGLDAVWMPAYRMRHRDLGSVCLPQYRIWHANRDAASCMRFRIRHRNLDGNACLPRLNIRHRDLNSVCMSQGIQLRHRNLDGYSCQPQWRIRHRNMDGLACTQQFRIPHRNMDRFVCEDLIICHTPLHKYKVMCDPNITRTTTNMERVGMDVKNFFTNHRKHCKLMDNYAGVGAGAIVETYRFGDAQVVDFVIRNQRYTRFRWDDDSTNYKLERIKVRGVHRLVVSIPKAGRWRTVDGRPHIRQVRLSAEETKQIMLANLIQRDKVAWIIRMYPEERENIEAIRLRYAPGLPYHRPMWIAPRLIFNTD